MTESELFKGCGLPYPCKDKEVTYRVIERAGIMVGAGELTEAVLIQCRADLKRFDDDCYVASFPRRVV